MNDWPVIAGLVILFAGLLLLGARLFGSDYSWWTVATPFIALVVFVIVMVLLAIFGPEH